MRFPTLFRRQKGSASSDPALGDSEPTISTGAPASNADNVLVAKVGSIGNPSHRIAIGFRFDPNGGGGTTGTLTAKVWAYDSNSEKWYLCGSATLTDGQLSFVRVPYIADPPQTSGNLGKPTSGGATYLITVADPGAGSGTGIYTFVAGPDLAIF